jgi:hypothetical protein
MVVNAETTVRKLVSLPRDLVREIADYRFANRLNTEAEAIRRLIEAGLEAEGRRASDGGPSSLSHEVS